MELKGEKRKKRCALVENVHPVNVPIESQPPLFQRHKQSRQQSTHQRAKGSKHAVHQSTFSFFCSNCFGKLTDGVAVKPDGAESC